MRISTTAAVFVITPHSVHSTLNCCHFISVRSSPQRCQHFRHHASRLLAAVQAAGEAPLYLFSMTTCAQMYSCKQYSVSMYVSIYARKRAVIRFLFHIIRMIPHTSSEESESVNAPPTRMCEFGPALNSFQLVRGHNKIDEQWECGNAE